MLNVNIIRNSNKKKTLRNGCPIQDGYTRLGQDSATITNKSNKTMTEGVKSLFFSYIIVHDGWQPCCTQSVVSFQNKSTKICLCVMQITLS